MPIMKQALLSNGKPFLPSKTPVRLRLAFEQHRKRFLIKNWRKTDAPPCHAIEKQVQDVVSERSLTRANQLPQFAKRNHTVSTQAIVYNGESCLQIDILGTTSVDVL